jgi:uncharacterized protein (TIGR03083 family)
VPTGIRLSDADVPTLISAWEGTHRDLLSLAAGLDDAGWRTPTDCPGWSVGDLVAHTAAIEKTLVGETDPPHEPDWHALPHATGDFGRWAEVPVDLRRSWPRERVQEELADLIDRRLAMLVEGPQRLDAQVPSQFGGTADLERVLRMRTFDAWAHEQDARRAVGRPGHLGSAGAWVTANQLLGALPYVWGKAVGAPVAATLRVEVTGPGVTARQTVRVSEGGRAARVPDTWPPTVTLNVSWPDLVLLGCGRVDPDDVDLRARVGVDGDDALAARLLPALSITP